MACRSLLSSSFILICFIILAFIPPAELPCDHLSADLGGTILLHGIDEDWSKTDVLEYYVHKEKYIKMITVTGGDIQFTATYENRIVYIPSNNSFHLHQLTLSDEGWYVYKKNSKQLKCYQLNVHAVVKEVQEPEGHLRAVIEEKPEMEERSLEEKPEMEERSVEEKPEMEERSVEEKPEL